MGFLFLRRYEEWFEDHSKADFYVCIFSGRVPVVLFSENCGFSVFFVEQLFMFPYWGCGDALCALTLSCRDILDFLNFLQCCLFYVFLVWILASLIGV